MPSSDSNQTASAPPIRYRERTPEEIALQNVPAVNALPVRRRLFPVGDQNALTQSLKEEVAATECNIEDRFEILEEIRREPIRPSRFLVSTRTFEENPPSTKEIPVLSTKPEDADET